jgi:hypothetical protein
VFRWFPGRLSHPSDRGQFVAPSQAPGHLEPCVRFSGFTAVPLGAQLTSIGTTRHLLGDVPGVRVRRLYPEGSEHGDGEYVVSTDSTAFERLSEPERTPVRFGACRWASQSGSVLVIGASQSGSVLVVGRPSPVRCLSLVRLSPGSVLVVGRPSPANNIAYEGAVAGRPPC